MIIIYAVLYACHKNTTCLSLKDTSGRQPASIAGTRAAAPLSPKLADNNSGSDVNIVSAYIDEP